MKRLVYLLACLAIFSPVSNLVRAAETVDPNKQYNLELVFWDKTDVSVTSWGWVTAEYRKVRPNVNVTVSYHPHRGYADWFRTQFIAGTAPDMLQMFPHNYTVQGPIEGNLIPLKQFYFKPSAYSPSKRWIDDFYSIIMVANSDPYYGEIWSLPMRAVTLRMFYNQGLFNQFGIQQAPRTWSEFLAVCETIKQKSNGTIVPLVTDKGMGWLKYFLNSSIQWGEVRRVDKIIPDLQPDKIEIMAALYKGTVSTDDDIYYLPVRLMRELYVKGYIPSGFAGLDGNQADNIFINQQAAMIQNGCWALPDYKRKIAGDFAFGIFDYPYVDAAVFPGTGGMYAEGVGSYGSDICVTKVAEKRGNLPACIDFLQFYASRPITKGAADRVPGGVPFVKGIELTDEAKAFQPKMYGADGVDIFTSIEIPDINELFSEASTAYIDGTIDEAEFKRFVKRGYFSLLNKEAAKTIKDQKMGIYKSCRSETEFYRQQQLLDDLRQRAGTDTVTATKLARVQETLRMRAAAITDTREETEKKVVAMVGAYLKGNPEKFRHVPLISKTVAQRLRLVALLVLAGVIVGLAVFLAHRQRYRRVLAYDRKRMYLFVAASLVLLATFNYLAALSGIYHAFTEWDGVKVNEFIGLANFTEMFQDSILGRSVINLLIILGCFLFQLIPPILCAVTLFHVANQRMQYAFRVAFVLPMIIPWMVFLLVWKFLYQPAPYGAINQFLTVIGLGNVCQNWLANPTTALGAVIFLGFPWISTVGVLIYLAGLQNIPESVFEAAEIDGAGAFKRFFHIELPLIMRQIKINLVLGLVGTIQSYGLILVLTGSANGTAGGPLYSTTVPGLRMYIEAFTNGRLGYASAIGFMLFLTILTLTMLNVKYVKVKDDAI
jgi:raffinose/stachyose/melibiose transport system permease protein